MTPNAKKSKRISVTPKAAIKSRAEHLKSTTIDSPERAKQLLKESRAISLTRPLVPGSGKGRRKKRKVLRSIIKSFKEEGKKVAHSKGRGITIKTA